MSEAVADAPAGSPLWRRTLWTMVMIQLVMSASFTLLSPIMPLFLPELGVRTASQVNLWAGILASVTSFVGIFTAPLWGSLADKYGRKLMVLRSTLGIAVFTLLMGVAMSAWQMLCFRLMMGVFAGFNSAAIVLVASQVPEQRLGTSLGLLSTGQLVGSLLGPVVGGAVADITGSYRIPFFFAGTLSLCAFVSAWALVPERFKRPSDIRQTPTLFQAFSVLNRSGGLIALIVVMLLAQFGVQAVQPVVTLYVQELVGNQPNLATLGGVAFSATGIAGVLAVPFLGRRSDQIGCRRVLLISLFGAAALTFPQAFAHNYPAFVVERFAVGLFVGGILPAANALIGRLAAASHRGFVYGLTSSASFMGNSLGPLTGGAVAATVGIRWVFLVTAIMLSLNLVWVWLAVPEVARRAH